MNKTVATRTAYLIYALTLSLLLSGAARVMAATEVGSFTAPLSSSLGGTGVASPTAHTVPINEGASAQANVTALTNGQLIVGSTGADPAAATLGTGTGISISVGAGTLTVNNTGVTSVSAGAGISLGATTGACSITNTLATRTIVAKTGNYTVLSGDTANIFTNGGAAGTVIFTLPTAAAGLNYTFEVTTAQTVEILAGASTTIQVGGSVSTSAGNFQASTVGYTVTVVGIDSTHWFATCALGSWTGA